MNDIQNQPIYQIQEQFEAYPPKLKFEGETPEQILKNAAEQLIAEPTREMVKRYLSNEEIEQHRKEYTSLLENDKPSEEAVLHELLLEDACLKDKIKTQREALQSINTHVDDKIKLIKDGVDHEHLNADRSIRIALDGRYLHYTLVDGVLVLAKVEDISIKDQGGLFTRQTKNQEVFIRMFGCHFTPSERFEELDVKQTGPALVGRQLAASAISIWTEDLTDEDTGEIITIERTDIVLGRDTILGAKDVDMLSDCCVTTVVVYKEASNDAPSA